ARQGDGHEIDLRPLDAHHALVHRARLRRDGSNVAPRRQAGALQLRSPIQGIREGNLMARMVNCIKLKKEAEGLDHPPYPGELGKKLWESVSKEAWKAWLEHQKMLVNENRLNL